MDRVQAKIAFANDVLEILESDEEWSAETVDDIASRAIDLGLAHTDNEGYFRITETDDNET
jgi:predicted transcriptional regulator